MGCGILNLITTFAYGERYNYDVSSNVQFTQRELDAAFTLIRPELNRLVLQGQEFQVYPAPALKFFGVHEAHIAFDMGEIVNIVGLQFNQLRSKKFVVRFMDQGLELRVLLEDQKQALKSKLGTLSIEGTTLVGIFSFKENARRQPRLALKTVRIEGAFSGTGLLKPKIISKNLIKVLGSVLQKYLGDLVANEKVQDSIYQGLLGWGKFYSGEETQVIVPSTLKMNDEGIYYQVN